MLDNGTGDMLSGSEGDIQQNDDGNNANCNVQGHRCRNHQGIKGGDGWQTAPLQSLVQRLEDEVCRLKEENALLKYQPPPNTTL